MKYVIAYLVGGFVAVTVAPVPGWMADLHGVVLGLVGAGVFLAGSAIACAIVAGVEMPR